MNCGESLVAVASAVAFVAQDGAGALLHRGRVFLFSRRARRPFADLTTEGARAACATGRSGGLCKAFHKRPVQSPDSDR